MRESDTRKGHGKRCVNRKVAHDNRTGAPEGLPREFVGMLLDFPERTYGMWWYINDDGTSGNTEGWYIWLGSINLLGVSRGENIVWRVVDDFQTALTTIAHRIPK